MVERASMQHVIKGYRGLEVILTVNSDRLFSIGTVVAGLICGALVGSALMAV